MSTAITTSLFWMERSKSPDMYTRESMDSKLVFYYNMSECRMIDALIDSEVGTFLVRYLGRSTRTEEKYLCDVYEISERKGENSQFTVVQHMVYAYMHTPQMTIRDAEKNELYADSWIDVLGKLGLRAAQCCSTFEDK